MALQLSKRHRSLLWTIFIVVMGCVAIKVLFIDLVSILRKTHGFDFGTHGKLDRYLRSKEAGIEYNTNDHKTKTSSKSIVLVIAYYRSGSTLTADIIQQSNEVFYLYEPLKGLNAYSYFTKTMHCAKGRCRYPMTTNEDPSVVKKHLSYAFACDMQKLHKSIIDDIRVSWARSLDGSVYRKCLKSSQGKDVCLKQLADRCERAQVRLIKSIRLTLELAEDLMKSHPNLKIIHVLRDPRGKFASEDDAYVYSKNQTKVQDIYNFYCKRVLNDVIVGKRLNGQYRDRIKTVLYEDIATNPIRYLHDIYNFIGIPVTKEIEKYVFQITMAGINGSDFFGTQRKNSVKTAYNWKKKLPKNTKQAIMSMCKDFFDETHLYQV